MLNKELVTSFLEEAQEVLTSLEAGVTAVCQGQIQAAERSAQLGHLSVLAHRLRGSAALYGFPQLAKTAALLERVLEARAEFTPEEQTQYDQLLGTTTGILRQGLDTITAGQQESNLGLAFSKVGGAEQLQALLRSNPQAFTPRAAGQLPHPEEPEVPNSETELVPDDGLEGQLRAFMRENAEVWEYFAPEVQEHLGNMRSQLEQDESDLDVMFRAAHTIKGSSYMVGLDSLGNFAHRLEDLLGAARDGAVRLDAPARDLLGAATDTMERMLRVAGGSDERVSETLQAQVSRLTALASGDSAVPEPQPSAVAAVAPSSVSSENSSIRVPARQLEGLMDQIAELVTARARLGQSLGNLDDLQESMLESQQRFQRTVRDFEERHLNPDMVRSNVDETPSGTQSDLTQQFDELEFDTYNDLNILARSITELSADFAEVRRRLTDAVVELQDENEQMGKLVRRLRLDISQTSRLNFAQVSARLKRWAREHQGRVELTVEGDDVKVDSAILQRLADPLLHLLTNALHHGIGSAEERQAQGKNPRGQVWLRAQQRSNFLEVTVQDDGRGLNLDAIAERALERGLRSAQELKIMARDELARLILLPGLSTAEQVGTVAGRGVGMDVVATTTRQLGGELLIRSTPGEGTAFTLRLPTSRRIMDILEVEVAGSHLAFAVSSVRALREFTTEQLTIGEHGFEVPFEGQNLPIIDLRDIWGAVDSDDRYSLVILSTLNGDIAARVDEFGQIEEASVTPPSPLLSQLEYLSGTALSASGEVRPILDPLGLVHLARRPDTWLRSESQQDSTSMTRVLLVDDSLSVRKLVGRMLERGGLEVVTANDGQEALDLLQLDPDFGAVISDLEMPRMNGYELLSNLRSRPATAKLPVMIMTTRAGEKHQRLAFQLGAQDYFTKPVNESMLLRRLGSLISQGGVQA